MFLKYIIDNISTANVFHSRRGKSNTHPNSCDHLTRCYRSGSFFKIKVWNYVWRLVTPWGSDRKRNLVDIPLNGAKAGYGTWIFQNRSHFLVWFSSGFRLQYQFCYTHRQYFDISGNFRVFSILICQLYAYSSIWSWIIYYLQCHSFIQFKIIIFFQTPIMAFLINLSTILVPNWESTLPRSAETVAHGTQKYS